MGRKAGVWYFADRDGWYTTHNGNKVRVADGNVSGKEALELWHQMMAKASAAEAGMDNPFKVVADLYLDHLAERSARSYGQSKRCLAYFCSAFPKLRVADLTAPVLYGFLNRPQWNASTRNLNGSIIKRVLGWASRPDMRIIERNPLQGCPLPGARSRGAEAVMQPGQHTTLMKYALRPLADVLAFLQATGCRPITLCRLERKHYLADARVFRLEEHKTAEKTGTVLLVPVPDAVADLVAGLCLKHPEGPLWRTTQGKRWTPYQISRSLLRLQRKLERKGRWPGPHVTPYHYRHTLATVCLEEGMTDADVAAVLGHKGVAMVHRHYGHVESRMGKVVDRLSKVVNGRA